MRCLILFLVLITNLSFAAEHFSKVGELASFQWSLPRYQNKDFFYDVFYYIPATLAKTKNAPAIIFMHGGGDSTLTREGAIKTVHRYTPDLIKLADELQFVLVVPSSNGLNWGGHTRGFIRDLAGLVRKELEVDGNNFGLVGHSMGGMGITRSANWLTDQFSFFLPTAAGMDPRGAVEENLVQNFNTVYEHHQGLKDDFQIFIERCHIQEKAMKDLEVKYGLTSGLTIKFYDGPHNYDRPLLKAALDQHFKKTRRNLYQEKLFGSLYFANGLYVENKIQFHLDEFKSYFWIEVLEADTTVYPFRLNIQAEIDDAENKVTVKFENNAQHIKKLRVYVSSKNLNLDRKIIVEVNGKKYFNKKVKTNRNIRTYLGTVKYLRNDPQFNFDSHIDIDLSKPLKK